MACYLFFRCWPGFTEDFPVERFNALSEAELPEALDRFAREQLRAQKAKIKAVRGERMQRLHEALLRQSRRVLRGGESSFARAQLRAEKAETKTVPADPKERLCEASLRQLTVLAGSGGPAPGKRLTRRELFAQHVRKAPDRSPLVCRVGGYLGWWGGGKSAFGDSAAGPRVWFLRTNDRAFAEYLVGRLNGRTLAEDFEVVEVEKVLSPRFGYVAAEGLGRQERAEIQRQVNAIRDGEEPPVWHAKMALLLGQRARQFAEREAVAWVDSADPEWRRKDPATIREPAEQVLPTKAAVAKGGSDGAGGKPDAPPGEPPAPGGNGAEALRFIPGGYEYEGHRHDLSGKALEIFRVFADSRTGRVDAATLQQSVWADTMVEPATVVKAVSTLRHSLRRAMKRSRIRGVEDPLLCVDRGANLAWQLKLPLH